MSYKSRGNWHIPLSDEQYKSIFGDKKKGDKDAVNTKTLKYKLDFMDNPNAEQILKIGKEIAKMKRLDGVNPKRIEAEFGRDANKLFEKKIDRTLVKEIAQEVCRKLRRQ